jgi:DNA-binding MarR family transcriptional regulator
MRSEVIHQMADRCILLRTRVVSRVVTGIYDQVLRPFGLNSPQFALLVVIHKIGPATRAEIGRFHQQEKSTLTRNLQVMLNEGWIEEVQDQTVRGRPIVLTEGGIKLLHDVEPAWQEGQRQAQAILGEAGTAAVTEISDSITRSKTGA